MVALLDRAQAQCSPGGIDRHFLDHLDAVLVKGSDKPIPAKRGSRLAGFGIADPGQAAGVSGRIGRFEPCQVHGSSGKPNDHISLIRVVVAG